MTDLGVPIGWPDNVADLPACNSSSAQGQFCLVTGNLFWLGIPLIWPSLPAAIWLVLGGLLVGLGSPFWARAISALTGAQKGVAKVTEILDGTKPSAGAIAVMDGKQTNSTAVRTFEVSQNAKK